MQKSAARQRSTNDDWTKVEDATERKKIQNRLAQRLHRKKYGRKKKNQTGSARDDYGASPSKSTQNPPTALNNDELDSGSIQVESIPTEDVEIPLNNDIIHTSPDSSTIEGSLISETLSSNRDLAYSLQQPKPSPLSNTNFLVLQSSNTISALLFNASLLNIACSEVRGRSIFLTSTFSTPKSLAPTPLQLMLPHYPYIDILPLPALRNKLLQASEIIDPKDIWQDLLNNQVKMWGTQSWDERGWEITEAFATKWWFLMDDEVLGTTNFWRAARGEQALNVAGLKNTIGERITAA